MAKGNKKLNPGKKAMFEEAKSLESKGMRQKLGSPPGKNPPIKGKELDEEASMGKMPGKAKGKSPFAAMGKTKGKPMMENNKTKMPKKGKK